MYDRVGVVGASRKTSCANQTKIPGPPLMDGKKPGTHIPGVKTWYTHTRSKKPGPIKSPRRKLCHFPELRVGKGSLIIYGLWGWHVAEIAITPANHLFFA